jgi:hypothetical protein
LSGIEECDGKGAGQAVEKPLSQTAIALEQELRNSAGIPGVGANRRGRVEIVESTPAAKAEATVLNQIFDVVAARTFVRLGPVDQGLSALARGGACAHGELSHVAVDAQDRLRPDAYPALRDVSSAGSRRGADCPGNLV